VDGTDPSGVAPENLRAAERFYSGATRRISRALLAIAFALTAPVWWRYGMAAAIGFAAGGILSWLNFRWLERVVDGLAERVTGADSPERGRSIIVRLLLRYLLAGFVAYAIFRGSVLAFRGFLFGLCLPVVAAMLCEAAYEAYAALRRGY
jgi:hypothetical protein